MMYYPETDNNPLLLKDIVAMQEEGQQFHLFDIFTHYCDEYLAEKNRQTIQLSEEELVVIIRRMKRDTFGFLVQENEHWRYSDDFLHSHNLKKNRKGYCECLTCHKEWMPSISEHAKLNKNWWLCPTGCNKDIEATIKLVK